MKKLLVVLLLLGGVAHAQNYAAPKFRLIPQANAPAGASGEVFFWSQNGLPRLRLSTGTDYDLLNTNAATLQLTPISGAAPSANQCFLYTGGLWTPSSGCILSSGSYADPSWVSTLAGSKIIGAVANATNAVNATNTTNFSGSLSGDVVGPQGATSVPSLPGSRITGAVANATSAAQLQGTPVSVTAPTGVQALVNQGGVWTPTAIVNAIVNGVGLSCTSSTGTPTCSVLYGTTSTTATAGNDARLAPAPSAAGNLVRDTGNGYAAIAAGTGGQVLHGGTSPSFGVISTGDLAATAAVLSSGTYSDPTWITALAASKISGGFPSVQLSPASASNPFALGQSGVYLNTDGSTHYVSASGSDVPLSTIQTFTARTTDGTTTMPIGSFTLAPSSQLDLELQAIGKVSPRNSDGGIGVLTLRAQFESDSSGNVRLIAQDAQSSGSTLSASFPLTPSLTSRIVGSRVDALVTGAASTTIDWTAVNVLSIPLPQASAAASTGPVGPTGQPGVNWRGAWSSSPTYQPGDGVSYPDPTAAGALSSFRSLLSNTNAPPVSSGGVLSANWAYVAQALSPGVFVLSGGVADWNGFTGTDNRNAINNGIATVSAVGGGRLIIPPGSYKVLQDPNTAHATPAIVGASNVSLEGNGDGTVLYINSDTNGPYNRHTSIGAFGSYTDYPGLGSPPSGYPPARLGINPVALGTRTITANPSGQFATVVAGDWLEITEGPPPKWDDKLIRAQVESVSGDTITLVTPTDLEIDNEFGNGIGIIRFVPISNFWVKHLTITGNANTYPPQWGQTVGGGVEDVLIDLPFQIGTRIAVSMYANDTLYWTMRNSRMARGIFTGFNRANHGEVTGNRFLHVANKGAEFGQGENYSRWHHNWFLGIETTGLGYAGVIGGGNTWYCDYTDNYFAGQGGTTIASVLAAKSVVGMRFSRNVVIGAGHSPISLALASPGVSHPSRDVYVEGNLIVYDKAASDSAPVINVGQYPDVQHSRIVDNILVAPSGITSFVKVGGGNNTDSDKRTLEIHGNKRSWTYGAAQGGVGVTVDDASGTAGIVSVGSGTNFRNLQTVSKLNWNSGTSTWSVSGPSGSYDIGAMLLPMSNSPSGTGIYTTTWATVTQGGSYGALNGGATTGAITSGTNTVTLSAGTGVTIGKYITIAGAGNASGLADNGNANVFRITAWNSSTLVATLDGNATATVSGAAVAYSAPVIVTMPGPVAAQPVVSGAATLAQLITAFNNLLAAMKAGGSMAQP